MDTPIGGRSGADLRDYLAEERTFLAWIRTGIALMGFGVVAAHFGLFADESHITQHASVWFGTALIALGVAVNLDSARRYIRLVGELNRGQFVLPLPVQGSCDCRLVPGAARHSHDDLPDLDPGAAAGAVACMVRRHGPLASIGEDDGRL